MSKHWLCAAGSVLALSIGSVAFGDGVAHAQTASSRDLEEVVVTARRAEESAQSVPVTVTAITAEKLEANVIQSGLDLQKMVPTLSVVMGSQANGASYALRGIRNGVVTYLNEAPTPGTQAGASAVNLQLFDLSSVQAISGPQGTLFGRNSTGGAILFVPQKPTKNFEGSIEGEYGNYNRYGVTGVLNIPVNDMLQIRLGTQVIRRDGVVKNTLGDDLQDIVRSAYRLGILFTPNDKLTNYTLIDSGHVGGHEFGSPTFHYPGGNCPATFAACVYGPTLLVTLQAQQDAFGPRKIASHFPEYQHGDEFGAQNVLTYELNDQLGAKYIASYRRSFSQNLHNKTSYDVPFVYGQDRNETFERVHEVQLHGDVMDGRLSGVGGVFYRHVTSKNFNALQILNPVGTPFTVRGAQSSPSYVNNESLAFYAQGNFKVTDQLRLTAGIRRTRDDQHQVSSSFLASGACGLRPAPAVNLVTCQQPQQAVFKATTYLVSLDYQITDGVLVYATTRTGYNAGGFNQGIVNSDLGNFKPEHLTDYEAGIKADWRLGDVPVRTNVAAFYGKYKDIQRGVVQFVNNVAISGTFNAAEATVKGVQAEFLARPTDFLDLNGSVGWLDTVYNKFNPTAISAGATGNKFAQAPEWTVNLAATYHQDLSFAQMAATLSYAYIDDVTFTDSNIGRPFAFTKGYGLMDFNLDLKNIGGSRVTAGVWVKNLTNKTYIVNISDQSASLGFVSNIYGDPRTYGVQLRYEFGS
jgi:iron complex outermembrane receptor protein